MKKTINEMNEEEVYAEFMKFFGMMYSIQRPMHAFEATSPTYSLIYERIWRRSQNPCGRYIQSISSKINRA